MKGIFYPESIIYGKLFTKRFPAFVLALSSFFFLAILLYLPMNIFCITYAPTDFCLSIGCVRNLESGTALKKVVGKILRMQQTTFKLCFDSFMTQPRKYIFFLYLAQFHKNVPSGKSHFCQNQLFIYLEIQKFHIILEAG